MKELNEILKLDVKSEEFFKCYKAISKKYWTFENPDEWQKAAKTLVMFAERYDSDKVILCLKIAEEIVKMSEGADTGNKSARMHLSFNNHAFYIDIYQNEDSKDDLDDVLSSMDKAFKNGNVVVKDKYGKRYF